MNLNKSNIGMKATVDQLICRGCGICRVACPNNAIIVVFGKAQVDKTKCTGCGRCVNVCILGAIRLVCGKDTKKEKDFKEKIKELKEKASNLSKRIEGLLAKRR